MRCRGSLRIVAGCSGGARALCARAMGAESWPRLVRLALPIKRRLRHYEGRFTEARSSFVAFPPDTRHADHPPLHPRRARPVRRPRVRPAELLDPQPQRVGRLRDERRDGARRSGRRSRSISSRRSTSAGPVCRPRLSRVHEDNVPTWIQRSAPGVGGHPDRRRDRLAAGVPPAGGVLDVLGLEGRLLLVGERRAGVLRRSRVTCSPRRWRPRTARSGSTRACTGPTGSKARRRATTSSTRTRSNSNARPRAYERPAPHACFIQQVSDDLVNDGGIMDLWVREARIFKYGSGTGLEFLRAARRGRAAVRRREVVRADELPQDRRPRGRRHQERRDHAPRREDGRSRPRSPGHRGVRQLEGDRGAEGRGPRHRVEAAEQAPQRDHARRPRARGRGGAVRPGEERRSSARPSSTPAPRSCRRTTSPACCNWRGRGGRASRSTSTTPTGTRRRTTRSAGRTATTRCASPTSS